MKIKSQEEIALAQEKANEMIRVMYDKIENLSEYTVPLYDVIEGYFFQDIDYQRLRQTFQCGWQMLAAPQKAAKEIRKRADFLWKSALFCERYIKKVVMLQPFQKYFVSLQSKDLTYGSAEVSHTTNQ